MERAEELRQIKRAQRGNQEAFAALYQANVQTIFRYIYYRTNDIQLAEDLTADVFVQALEALPRYQDQGKPFIAWLYRIAQARVVDQYRKAARRPVDSELNNRLPAIQSDADQAVLRRQTARVLREAISHLTPEQQSTVILRFIEGYSIEDTAQITGKPAGAVKSLQHRALRALARRLERSGVRLDDLL